MIETVFLDAGGVLVNPNWERVAEAMARQGVEVSAAALAAAEPHAKRQLDTGQAVKANNDSARGWLYFNLVLERAGVSLSDGTDAALRELAEYHARFNLWESVPADVPDALDRLRRSGRRLVVVSNANGTLRAHFARLGLADRFDVLVDSCDEGVEKPDPRIFASALERLGVAPDRAIHVGDIVGLDVRGARRAGVEPVLMDPLGCYPGSVECPRIQRLADLLDLVPARAQPAP
ncbi:MAG: hypothetical protein DMF78_19040 [Acidobacteria bacterium]|nr:MAG: hypothetical protein DMF78_19040 [Acidobacteriota bacterium]